MSRDRSRSPGLAKRFRSRDRASYRDAPYKRDRRLPPIQPFPTFHNNMDPFFHNRQELLGDTMEVFNPSPNIKYHRSMLHSEMDLIFNRLVERCFKKLKNYAFVSPLEGDARKKHGDYVCLSVLEACEEIRKSDPYLFDKKSPRAIAEEIMGGIRNQNVIFNMINQQSILVHDAGMITFRLDGSWIAHRIDEMLINGIDTWAPKLYDRKTRAIVVSSRISGTHLLIDFMKPALAHILLYSGIDVFVSPKLDVDVDLKTIRYGVCKHKADVMVYVTPHLEREYIEKGFADARSEKWFRADPEPTLACCGCRSLSFDQERNLSQIFNKLSKNDFEFFYGMAKDSGYDPAQYFYCLIKYTLLKKYRLAEVTLSMESMEEMFDIDGNTLVNILRTKAIISNIIKNSISPGKLSESEKALAGEGERELGLQLVEFTGVVEEACRNLAPHLLCEYLFDLSKLFMSYHLSIGKANVKLCRATEVVISRCFHLLGINPSQLNRFRLSSPDPFGVRRVTIPHRFPRSRFELFTMRVFVAHPAFDEGSIFGNIWVEDAKLARSDGWTMVDGKDQCYVSYFNHEWHQPLNITYGSLIPFGDPSCRRSVPISSSLEVHVLLHAMSENKQHCYLLFHGKDEERRSKNWYKQRDAECPEAECGALELESNVGTVLINYILLKNAVDALMELLFWSSNPNVCVKIRGSIIAYYGDDVVKDGDILGRYKAVIFRTTNFESTGMKGVLPLHRSLLAVPANGCLKIKANLVDVVSGTKYVRETSYRAAPGKDDNLLIKCGDFSINLKVAWRE